MSARTKPKDLIIDFINTVFLIVLGVVTFVLFIVKDYLFVVATIGRAVFASSLLGLIFFLQYKIESKKIEHNKKYELTDEVAVYFSKADIYKSSILSIFTVLSIISFAQINGKIDSLSVLYVMIISVILIIWHITLFKRKGDGVQMYYATNKQMINDKLAVFMMPFIMMILTIFNEGVNMLRVLQILTVFGILYIKHYLIFKKKKV